jgi:transcriptional regulator with XRE-family HTH domain
MDKDQIKIAFGEHLTRLRMERGLSIHKLAEASDLEYSHVQRIEKGKVNAALTTLTSLAQGLDMSLEELFSGFNAPQ